EPADLGGAGGSRRHGAAASARRRGDRSHRRQRSIQELAVKALALSLALLAAATAEAKSVPHLRVIVPRASVRTGPGATYRELYRAGSGEVMEVIDRNGSYWFRVIMPDGRFGWI